MQHLTSSMKGYGVLERVFFCIIFGNLCCKVSSGLLLRLFYSRVLSDHCLSLKHASKRYVLVIAKIASVLAGKDLEPALRAVLHMKVGGSHRPFQKNILYAEVGIHALKT